MALGRYRIEQYPNCGRIVHLYGKKNKGILCICGEELHVNDSGALIVTPLEKRIYKQPIKNRKEE